MQEEEQGKKGIVNTASLVLSGVFSPLLVPTYACAIALWITRLSILPERTRFLLSLIVFMVTAVVPMAVIILMMRMGKVSDTAISDRKQRGIPFIVTALCYLGVFFFMRQIHAPHWLSMFFLGAFASTAAAMLINLFWKISAHGMVMGGLCALVLFIAYKGLGTVWMLPWITAAVLLAGAVGSARLYLGRHTPGQVYAGLLLGLGLVTLVVLA
ncbi:MAG: hypothetical protein NC548_52350 [Lachnospiraceae bacterium]|nr:hypothetical protein [Lachnospiraceae bacterium]